MSRLQQFISELKRRRVFRALIAWGIVSFAVLQIVEPLIHALGFHDWFLRVVVAALALGFPATLVLAWIFDLTSRGVVRTAGYAHAPAVRALVRRDFAALFVALAVASAVFGAGLALLAVRITAPSPIAAADGRITVAVADFANETRDPDLDALSGLLITSLEQSPRLRVMTRGRMFEVLDELGHGNVAGIDEKMARQVGRKAGVTMLLLATVRRFDDVYSVEMHALEPGRDEYLFSVKAEGRGKVSIPRVVDELSEKARQRVEQDEPAASPLPVGESITSNLEAYKHFFLGMQCLDRESWVRSVRCTEDFERAVARDPRFAIAHAYLASLRGQWVLPGMEESRAAALRDLARAPPREQLRIRFLVGGNRAAERLSIGREALAAFPDDRYLAFKLAQWIAYYGDPANAIPILRQLVDGHSTAQSPVWYHLVAALAVAGRRDELYAAARRLTEGPQAYLTLEALMLARGMLGDGPGMLESGRRFIDFAPSDLKEEAEDRVRFARFKLEHAAAEQEVSRLGDRIPQHQLTLAFFQMLHGRPRAAARTIEEWMKLPEPSPRRLSALMLRYNSRGYLAADLVAGTGDATAFWQYAMDVGAVGDWWGCLAASAAYLGDLDHAAALARPLEPSILQQQTYRAVALWRGGNREEARRLLEDLSSRSLIGWRTAALPPAFLLGELAAEMGDDRTAVTAFRQLQTFWLGWSSPHMAWVYPKSLYLAARSYRRLGELDEARAQIERLLELWERAEPDLPLLAEARTLAAQLAAR